MIGVPTRLADKSAADVTASGSFGEDLGALGCRERLPTWTAGTGHFLVFETVETELP